MASRPTGRLTKKIHRQLAASMRDPPISGPKIGASSIGTPTMLITRPIRFGPAAWARISWPSGMIIPPPRPCTARKPISAPIEGDSPASSEPAMKSPSEASHTGLAPNRPAVHPISGITQAKASR
jgi:hypothetical protein